MFLTKEVNITELEIKAQDNEMIIEGYASTFGNTDAVNDVIERGAFGKKLSSNKIKFLYQHDVRQPIGVIKSIYEDDRGVFMQAKFSDTQLGRDAYTLSKDGAIDAFSIGFMIDPKGYRYDAKSGIRYISKAKLMEVSAVTFPANDKAKVTAVKGIGLHGFKTKREFEEALEFMGFSQKESLIITAKAYPALAEHWDGGSKEGIQSDSELKELKASLDALLTKIKGN